MSLARDIKYSDFLTHLWEYLFILAQGCSPVKEDENPTRCVGKYMYYGLTVYARSNVPGRRKRDLSGAAGHCD